MPALRTGSTADIEAVLALWRSAASVPTVSDTREALAALLTRDPRALVVAELGGAVVGSVIAGWDGWRGNVYRLAVSPEHRRNGIGSALVREAERRLRDRGASRMSAIVVDDDPAAIGFWHASGLTRQSRRARFVRNL